MIWLTLLVILLTAAGLLATTAILVEAREQGVRLSWLYLVFIDLLLVLSISRELSRLLP